MSPVCYSSVALVNPDSAVCSACPHLSPCAEGARSRLRLMPDSPQTRAAFVLLSTVGPRVGQGSRVVSVSRRGVARRALSAPEQSRLSRLPVRARSVAARLTRLCWFDLARDRLREGEIAGGIEGTRLHLGLRSLLAGVATRKDLVLAFIASGLSEASAQVETSTALAVLEFGHLIRIDAGQIQLSPN